MKLFLLVCVMVLVGVTAGLALAQQPLPSADWYAVIYEAQSDTLHWANADGEQASMSRPRLPEEAFFLGLRMSPDGRYMVVGGVLNNGREGIGVYDFQFGRFIRTHEARGGEQINLGYDQIFSADSSSFAIGLFSGDFSNPAWRLILFETVTGDSMAFIDNTHPDAPDAGLAAPVVRYLDGVRVHFHLQPQAVGGSIVLPAYAWQISGFDPNVPIIAESPYDRTNLDILPGTGAVVAAMTDDSVESLPAPSFNSIAQGIPGSDDGLMTVHSDATRYHHQARWANGGVWILFYSDDQTGSGYWNIIEAENGTAMPFDPQFVDAYGTPDGYILVDGEGSLLLFNELVPSAATRIYQGSDQAEVIYLTPAGVTFNLAAIPEGSGLVAGATPTLVINEPPGVAPGGNNTAPVNDCPQALAQRVSVGSQARVIPSLGALNVRSQPGGSVVSSFSGGVTFNVIGGASCFDGLYWWQVQNVNASGWVAEGNFSNYYIQPWDGPVVLEPVPVPEEPAPPPPSQGENPGDLAPNPPAEEEPGIVVVVPEAIFSCPGSPTPRLSVGSAARVTSNTPMAVFQSAQGGSTNYELPPNVTVAIIGGPTCGAQNITYWQFSGNARNKVTQFAEQTTGWIPEGTGNVYWLSP